MAVRIVCVDPLAVEGATRTIGATGQEAAYGEEIEVEDSELAERLLEQEPVWARPSDSPIEKGGQARPSKKAAKVAEKEKA